MCGARVEALQQATSSAATPARDQTERSPYPTALRQLKFSTGMYENTIATNLGTHLTVCFIVDGCSKCEIYFLLISTGNFCFLQNSSRPPKLAIVCVYQSDLNERAITI